MSRTLSRLAVTAGLLTAMARASPLPAQLQGASPRALGMAGAYSLAARGYEAPSWNPAILALPGRSGVSVGLPQGTVELGSNTWGLGDVIHYANRALTPADKAVLLAQVGTALEARVQVWTQPMGFSVGRVALALTTTGLADVRVGRDAVDLALFGNARRAGPGEFFTGRNSGASAWALTTLAASAAWPVRTRYGDWAFGATAKRLWGRGLARAADLGSRLDANPGFRATGAGHAIHTTWPDGYQPGPADLLLGGVTTGRGWAVDLGAALRVRSGVTVGAVIANLAGGMGWNHEALRYDRVLRVVAQDSNGAVTDSSIRVTLRGRAIDGDTIARALREEMLRDARPSRQLRAGVLVRRGPLLLTGEIMARLGHGLGGQPAGAASAGAEVTVWRVLPLRVGLAADQAGTRTVSGGIGLAVGVVRLDVGLASSAGPRHHDVSLGMGAALEWGLVRRAGRSMP